MPGLLDLLFPRSCVYCEERIPYGIRETLCPACLQKIKPTRPPLCLCCGGPLVGPVETEHLCGTCLLHMPAYNRARSLFIYEDVVRGLIHGLKFGQDMACLRAIDALVTSSGWRAGLPVSDLVLPVPLHFHRLRSRGFNQAFLLAKVFFGKRNKKIMPSLLLRTRDTLPQTGLSGVARRRNLLAAFTLRDAEMIRGRKICLVDDVFTTGTTVDECSKVLRKNGAAEVEVLTLARVIIAR
ncbi:ComF family protein [Desulfotalea psychrophila]|uniref:Related to competence protein F n=1 Tax=Desulfotalea psychrophila (strain LSv54 / DSM 12343) TaxID=177439 RepID=Q6ARL6_DESPS|nr:ComF family protein [Desulfotalea psychrophila]CAG35009.1 related to competence protein F [Desulfotalea psychrophila LSv54]